MQHVAKAAMLLLPFLQVGAVPSASQSDPRLIQLVPAQSKVVAGMPATSRSQILSSFLILTPENKIDLQDFLAVIGRDTSRVIRRLVFVAAPGVTGVVGEHTLLVSGHFNRNAIFRFAEGGKASVAAYRNLPILVVPPFAREADGFHDTRWFAVLDSQIAIFGSPELVRQELDRWLAGSPPDSLLVERLAQLDPKDDSWCLLPAPSSKGVVQNLLGKLDARLGAVARRGESIEYGIHFGRRIEITASSNPVFQADNAPPDASDDQWIGSSFFFSRPDIPSANSSDRVVVKVSRREYENWLAEFSNRNLTITGEIVH